MTASLDELRVEIDRLNREILDRLNLRAGVAEQIARIKARDGMPIHAPEREQALLDAIVAANEGPLSNAAVRRLFREILEASKEWMAAVQAEERQVSRRADRGDGVVRVGDRAIGGEGGPVVIAGPCAVEDEAQVEAVAVALVRLGIGFLRGGAFKPRTSPYSFGGLGRRGLEILRDAARRHGLATVSEVTDPREVGLVAEHIDILQIGARNMTNYDLLREAGRSGRPVLLKRGPAATVEELLWSAEYVVIEGTSDVILCERGIRTFETRTRNTLDVSAVALLRRETWLPVVVDVSHAAGRRDILAPLARAAVAAGAHGVMIEVHPHPDLARSDGQQQLDLLAFDRFLVEAGLRA